MIAWACCQVRHHASSIHCGPFQSIASQRWQIALQEEWRASLKPGVRPVAPVVMDPYLCRYTGAKAGASASDPPPMTLLPRRLPFCEGSSLLLIWSVFGLKFVCGVGTYGHTSDRASSFSGSASWAYVTAPALAPSLQTTWASGQPGIACKFSLLYCLQQHGVLGPGLTLQCLHRKTLQVLALVWTALRQGPAGRPCAQKVIIVTPSSLCNNWAAEIRKWLGAERLKVTSNPP